MYRVKPKNAPIVLLVHPSFDPRSNSQAQVELDVMRSLKRLGHDVEVLAVQKDLRRLDRKLVELKPKLVFNLLEEFRNEAVFDFHVITWLEAVGIPFTGCNPRGLIRSRSKLGVYHLAQSLGVACPPVFPLTNLNKRYIEDILEKVRPVILKFDREHASLGLTQKSVCNTFAQVKSAYSRMRRVSSAELILQKFISGRELTVSLVGNRRPVVLPAWELRLPSPTSIASERIKFSAKVRRQQKVRAFKWKGNSSQMSKSCLRLFDNLGLSGYARFDFRLDSSGEAHLIDVNANPNLSRTEDLAYSAKALGWSYDELIGRVLRLAVEFKPRS